jgi:hypothetical protein
MKSELEERRPGWLIEEIFVDGNGLESIGLDQLRELGVLPEPLVGEKRDT